MRGRAVLAQNAEDWRRACLYWEDVIKEDPSDKEARFFLAQCRTLLGSRGDVSPEQRILLWKQAEGFYREELTGPPTPQQSNVLVAYAILKREQAKRADANRRQPLYNEAEQLLLHARKLAPQEVNLIGLLAELKLQQADEQSNPVERVRLREKAERLFLQAKELNPKEAGIHVMLSTLKIEQAHDAAPEDRDGLLAAAENCLAELLPQDSAKSLYNRACIAALRGQPDKALNLLEESRQAGTLPSREHLEKDKDMDSLRDLDAFREFLKQAYPTEDTRQPDNATKENE